MTSMECRYCGEMIADLESAPKDSMGAYCTDCEIGDAVDIALLDATDDDEGRPRAATFLRHLAREGFAVTKVTK